MIELYSLCVFRDFLRARRDIVAHTRSSCEMLIDSALESCLWFMPHHFGKLKPPLCVAVNCFPGSETSDKSEVSFESRMVGNVGSHNERVLMECQSCQANKRKAKVLEMLLLMSVI